MPDHGLDEVVGTVSNVADTGRKHIAGRSEYLVGLVNANLLLDSNFMLRTERLHIADGTCIVADSDRNITQHFG